MTIKGQIHWCEGLFLRPHHLQYMQSCIVENFAKDRRLYWNYPYGVVEAKISDDQLENMRVSFDRLRAVMPSGLEVNVPDNAYLPSLDIKEPFASSSGPLTVSLGVPTWSPSRSNVIEKNEVLPLMKIVHAAGEDVGLPRRDPAYIPPCLVVTGSPVLGELLRDITNQVMASRNELVVQVNRGGFSIENMRGIQFEQILRLRTLNRFSARLGSLIQAPNSVTPFEMYIELRQLLAELAALRPDRDQFEIVEYDHDNPAIAFNEVSTRIRGLLKGVVRAKFLKVSFTMDQEQQILVAALSDEALSLPNEYFLAIKTKCDPSELAKLVSDRDKFKLMPQSLANQRVFGVKLAQELYPPVELPAQVGLHYFRVMRSESARLWERIQQEKSIALRWPGIESSDFSVTLYMTVPDTEA